MLVKDFRELRATVERMGLLEPNQLFFLLLLGHILLLDIAAWLILFYFGTSLLPFVFSLLVLTISQVSNEFHGMDLHPTHTHTSSFLSFVSSLGTVLLCHKNTATIWIPRKKFCMWGAHIKLSLGFFSARHILGEALRVSGFHSPFLLVTWEQCLRIKS